MSCGRPDRCSQRSAAARPLAAIAAAPAAPIRKGDGKIGSAPPLKLTRRSSSSDHSVLGATARMAACGVMIVPWRLTENRLGGELGNEQRDLSVLPGALGEDILGHRQRRKGIWPA